MTWHVTLQESKNRTITFGGKDLDDLVFAACRYMDQIAYPKVVLLAEKRKGSWIEFPPMDCEAFENTVYLTMRRHEREDYLCATAPGG